MKDVLYHNPNIEIRKSPIQGWGVFAKEDIKKGELLEEVPFLTLPLDPSEASSLFIDYRFNYPSGVEKWIKQTIPFGFACLYNHSDKSNAWWYTDLENEVFFFVAIKEIKKDEEITTYYGDANYWKDGRSHTEVK